MTAIRRRARGRWPLALLLAAACQSDPNVSHLGKWDVADSAIVVGAGLLVFEILFVKPPAAEKSA